MRKSLFAAALLLAVFATSCGSESNDSTATDSTATDSTVVAVDSSACCADSSDSVIKVDTNREDAGPKIDNPN